MNEQRDFSLSYYFEELRQRTYQKGPQKEVSEEKVSFTIRVAVLKTLKGMEEHKLTLMTLARSLNMKIATCQEIVEYLGEEGLVEIETDEETGNDLIKLTQKGTELL